MTETADVAIIGGGISGCAIAYSLARQGCKKIVVFEKGYLTSGTTGRCAGGIRQQFGTETSCVLARDSLRSFAGLGEELDFDIEFYQGGYLLLAYTEKEHLQFQKNVALQRRLGIDSRCLSPAEAAKIVPGMNVEGVLGATFCPSDGQANPFKTTFAYAAAARRLGVRILPFTEVREIRKGKGKIQAVITNQGRWATPVVVNAAGPYSGIVGRMAGVELPVYSKRQQFMATEPVADLCKLFVIAFSRQVSFIQTPHGSILMGGGDPQEPPSFNFNASWQYPVGFARKVVAMMPMLKGVRIVRQWAGLYNITPDAQPIYGPHPEVKGFFMAIGFSGHGFMLGPITGKLTAEWILNGKPSLPVAELDVGRFERGETIPEPSVI
jgi:sarcosine oxidase, subunit beta